MPAVGPSSERYIEVQKVVLDYVKHITTLDTAAIVLLTTLLEKIFPEPEWKILVVVAMVAFLTSLWFLTLSALGLVRSIRTPDNVSMPLVRYTGWTFIVGLGGFGLGVASLAVFAIKNWL
jgi:L-asparagine transporter-like permease